MHGQHMDTASLFWQAFHRRAPLGQNALRLLSKQAKSVPRQCQDSAALAQCANDVDRAKAQVAHLFRRPNGLWFFSGRGYALIG
jgi:hypothetical protein